MGGRVSIERLETWASRLGMILGFLAILIPILGYRKSGARARGRASEKSPAMLGWSGMVAATMGYFGFGRLLWRRIPLPLTDRMRWLCLLAGSLSYGAGIGLYLWGYRSLGDQFSPSSSLGAQLYTDHQLITEGPYQFVRHPMYLGVLLAATGGLLIYRTWAMVFYGLSTLVVLIRAEREEQVLSAEFGEAWVLYRQRVPGWIPRIKASEV